MTRRDLETAVDDTADALGSDEPAGLVEYLDWLQHLRKYGADAAAPYLRRKVPVEWDSRVFEPAVNLAADRAELDPDAYNDAEIDGLLFAGATTTHVILDRYVALDADGDGLCGDP